MKTEEQAYEDLADAVAEEFAITSRLSPLEAAERAWHPSGPPVDELADLIAGCRAGTVPPSRALIG